MALDFPSNPVDGQVYDNYFWDAPTNAWRSSGSTSIPDFLKNATISTASLADVPLRIDGVASQTANLQEWRNSGGTVLSSISASGGLTLNNSLTVPNGGTGATSLTSGAYLKGNGSSPIQAQVGIPATDINSGKIDYLRLPAGAVRQVVYGYTNTQVTTSTSGSWTDTGLTATITPTSSTSKILIILNQNGITKQTSNNFESATQLKLLKNGVEFGALPGNLIGYSPAAGYLAELSVGYTLFDSPGTTSALTYKTQFKNYVNASFVSVQHYGGTSTITLLEILQ